MSLVPILLAGMNVPSWSYPVLRIFMGLSWTLIFFAILFGYTDRKEAVDQIENAMCNDMADIEEYYLGWNKEERVVEDGKDSDKVQTPIGEKKVTFDKSSKAATEIVKTRKPESERTASQFWVLTINSIPSATVAIDQRLKPVYNKRSQPTPPYKTFGQFICRRYGFAIPSFLQIDENPEPQLLFAAHKPKEASLQRLAIQREYQGFGLSTILISRAMMWANEHKLEWVNATLNEFQNKAINILKSKHGFKLISRKSTGWFGQYEVELRCNVKEWMERYADDVQEKHFNAQK
jgi:GNAT superfamily N-acetyltransferase